MGIHILGIRHHGVGSAKRVAEMLHKIKPDLILVEGPPEIAEMLLWIGNEHLKPPVALMAYNSENPSESVFYPFADYSPEWIAAKYANEQKINIRAIDLPVAISLENRDKRKTQAIDNEQSSKNAINTDPLSYFAEIDGFKSGEAWWDHYFEQNTNKATEHFQSVMLAMETLRESEIERFSDEENSYREAYMRNLIRQAENEMFENIVIVCGAWHAPNLRELDSNLKTDAKIIKALPKSKAKVTTTWIPWTNSRLSMYSGYGAGILSPGWYEHLWHTKSDLEVVWLAKVAEIFRKKGIDTSTAHIIEAFKLAQSLAAIRSKNHIGLEELNEATLSVMCMGESILLQFIKDNLIVGDKLGQVPEEIPKVPLQEDFERQLKSLRIKLSAAITEFMLDLRKEANLNKSILFHRLEILGIPWLKKTYARSKGTFKEVWTAEWSPEMMIVLIDNAYLGNTIEDASINLVIHKSKKTEKISDLAELINQCIPAELFQSVDKLLVRINDVSAISTDIVDLMKALPQLIDVSRYGNVRKSDIGIISSIVQQLLIKVFIGLPNGCYGLDEENSNLMFTLIAKLNHAIRLNEEEEQISQWYGTLNKIIDRKGVHPIIRGCVCRLLLDAQQLSEIEADKRISRALSVSNDPQLVASWIEGFLRGNASILIYDNRIWNLLFTWVSSVNDTAFTELLPMLRRAFSKFEFSERKQIGAKAKLGLVEVNKALNKSNLDNIDIQRAESILPVLKMLMGIE